MRRIDSLDVGTEFEWSGTRFRLESKEPVEGHDGRQYLSVTYLDNARSGAFTAGDAGLMPVDEDLDDLGCPW